MPDGGSSLEEVNDEGTFELGLQGGCAAYAIDRSDEGKLEEKRRARSNGLHMPREANVMARYGVDRSGT